MSFWAWLADLFGGGEAAGTAAGEVAGSTAGESVAGDAVASNTGAAMAGDNAAGLAAGSTGGYGFGPNSVPAETTVPDTGIAEGANSFGIGGSGGGGPTGPKDKSMVGGLIDAVTQGTKDVGSSLNSGFPGKEVGDAGERASQTRMAETKGQGSWGDNLKEFDKQLEEINKYKKYDPNTRKKNQQFAKGYNYVGVY